MLSSSTLTKLRNQFPLIQNSTAVYLDNAATTQKPQCVIDAVADFYQQTNANVHRASHALSAKATGEFEAARESVANFINARSANEIIWTRGTTEAINLVSQSYGINTLQAGDEIILTTLEHHANIVPWQLVAQQTGAKILVVDIHDDCSLNIEHYQSLLSANTKVVAISHLSNAIGVINPIKQMIADAHNVGAVVLVDGAQAVSHFDIDVEDLDCDFYAFSGHKMFGPTGIGVLYGKQALLEAMPPWQGGGEMIEKVSFSGTTFNRVPFRFEAGTPNIAGAIGLSAAIAFLAQQDRHLLQQHEDHLLNLAESELNKIEKLQVIGQTSHKAGALSFVIQGEHPSDIGTILDEQDIAVRTGHHCAMPLMERLQLNGTIRASFSIYNTEEDVLSFVNAVKKTLEFL